MTLTVFGETKKNETKFTFLLNTERKAFSVRSDLIEAKTTGCFDLLDEESKLPTPRVEHFTAEVHNRNRGHPRLDVRKTNFFSTNRKHFSLLVSEKIKTSRVERNSRR